MRENRTSGTVRGVPGNRHSYREIHSWMTVDIENKSMGSPYDDPYDLIMTKPGKRTRKQHILPVSYLNRFSTDSQIWVHNFDKKTSYVSNTRDTACIADFYTVQTTNQDKDDVVESDLLSKIEGIGNPIIDSIINRMCLPKDQEKALFANYLAIMYTRSFWLRQLLLEVHEHLAQGCLKQLTEDEQFFIKTMEDYKREKCKDFDLTFEQAKQVAEGCDISVDIARTHFVKEMMLSASKFVDIFSHMNLNLIYASPKGGHKFITADRPIAPTTPGPCNVYKRWIDDPNAQLYFPLSSLSCLMIDFGPQPLILTATKSRIASINRLIADECLYLAASQEKHFIWQRDNQTISDSPEELFHLLSDNKKTQPLLNKIHGQNMTTKCRSDVNLLKGKD